jgi:DNA replication and repair protein RecF
MEVHLSGRKVSGFASVASYLPVQVIDPEVHRLLEDGPKRRRRFMDWGVFHVEPRFIEAWRRYQRALRQRNAALKAKSPKELVTTWDGELIETGSFVAECRDRYLLALQSALGSTSAALLGHTALLKHRRGWPEGRSLSEAMAESWMRDQRYGMTHTGPHRADVGVEVDGYPAQERVSRGQQKLLAAAMMLAQLSYRATQSGDPACLLLDDPAAELDVDNLKKLLTEIEQTPAQLIVTALDLNLLAPYLNGKRFHVKQGYVEQVL